MVGWFELTLQLQVSQTGVERVDVVACKSLRHKVLDAPGAATMLGLQATAVNRGHPSSGGGVRASDGSCLGAGRVQGKGAAGGSEVAGLLGLDVGIGCTGAGQAGRARLCCRA